MAIQPNDLSVYLDEVGFQVRCALRAVNSISQAFEALDKHLADRTPGGHTVLLEEILRALHSVLTHSSCISKLLWPIAVSKRKGEAPNEFVLRRDYTAARGAGLRQALAVSDSSILKNRVVRDHLEHFDERLDKRCIGRLGGWVINNIGPLAKMPFDRRDLLRWFDQTTGEFFIQGDVVALPILASELQSLMRALPEKSRR